VAYVILSRISHQQIIQSPPAKKEMRGESRGGGGKREKKTRTALRSNVERN